MSLRSLNDARKLSRTDLRSSSSPATLTGWVDRASFSRLLLPLTSRGPSSRNGPLGIYRRKRTQWSPKEYPFRSRTLSCHFPKSRNHNLQLHPRLLGRSLHASSPAADTHDRWTNRIDSKEALVLREDSVEHKPELPTEQVFSSKRTRLGFSNPPRNLEEIPDNIEPAYRDSNGPATQGGYPPDLSEEGHSGSRKKPEVAAPRRMFENGLTLNESRVSFENLQTTLSLRPKNPSRALAAKRLKDIQRNLKSPVTSRNLFQRLFVKLYSDQVIGRSPELLKVNGDVDVWIEFLLRNGSDSASVRKIWQGFNYDTRLKRWPHIMIRLLQTSPYDACSFLEASRTTRHPRFLFICYCIVYLSTFFPNERILSQKNPNTGHTPCFSLLYIYNNTKLPPQVVSILVKSCDDNELERILDVTTRGEIFMPPTTMLFMMGRFTEAKKFACALKVLEYLARHEADLSDPMVLSRCATLLKASSNMPDDRTLSTAVLGKILGTGVMLNDVLFSVVLSNAFKAEGSEVGWKIYRHICRQGFNPNEVTYVTLLNDVISRCDEDGLENLVKEINQNEELKRSAILVSLRMHGVRQMNKKRNPYGFDDLIPVLFPVFAQLHDIQPLKDLGVVPNQWTAPDGASCIPPPPPALDVMVRAYLHAQTDPETIFSLYERFRGCVIAGHPSICELARTDQIYNAFLLALYRHVAYLPKCIRILEDMLAPLPEYTKSTHSIDASQRKISTEFDTSVSSRQTAHCNPSIHTWNILLLTFLYHQQPSAVEKIRSMMNKRGIKFDQVSWHTYLRGQAVMQDRAKMMRTLEEMENAGYPFDVDEWLKQKGEIGMNLVASTLRARATTKE